MRVRVRVRVRVRMRVLNGSSGRWRTVEEGVEIGRVDGGDLVGQLGEVSQVACSLRHRLLGLLSERVRHPIEQPALHDRLQTNNNSDDDDDDNAWLSGQSCLLPHRWQVGTLTATTHVPRR